MKLRQLLDARVAEAMAAAGIPDDCPPRVAPAKNPNFGDYQANGAMGAAKQLKTNPQELAARILDCLQLDDWVENADIAGPGFINLRLRDDRLGLEVARLVDDARLGVAPQPQPQRVVVDYSSPNLAKEMHVGHLRSTIIGDAVARVLEFLGHQVVRQNHVGDWGTQFGMLITHLQDRLDQEGQDAPSLGNLEHFYREAKVRFDEDPQFADRARANVVRLQQGDTEALAYWRTFIEISVSHAEAIYRKLNVALRRADIRPESAYNAELPALLEKLRAQGLVTEDQGAQVVFLDELADKDGQALPVIVQKSGGGYLYATTDLAAVDYRCHELKADRILYFIDARQSLHMKQVFAVSRRAGLAPPECRLEHHPFGTLMGADGKPFKTRSGDTVKLEDLLDEAVERAANLLADKGSELPPEEQRDAARRIGIGAVKYADLAKTRTQDYIFDWNQMLSFEGNTAPYLQYAYTRVRSLFRKAGIEAESLVGEGIRIEAPAERALAIKLLQFEEILEALAEEAMPHLLCNYLYELASLFMKFYESCPVLHTSVADDCRRSRLQLARGTARTLECGLGLLGIEVMERM